MRFGLVVDVLVETDDAVQLTAHPFLEVMVVPVKGRDDLVLMGIGLQVDALDVTVVLMLLHLHVAFHRVGGGGDADHTVGVAGTVIGEGRQCTVEVDLLGTVVHLGGQGQRTGELEIDTEEPLQPVGLRHQERETEVIVGLLARDGQARQGWELGTHIVGDALCERLVVEIALQLRVGEVALQ